MTYANWKQKLVHVTPYCVVGTMILHPASAKDLSTGDAEVTKIISVQRENVRLLVVLQVSMCYFHLA